jgi:glycosyltransferase involved in cell wall biosynthesis
MRVLNVNSTLGLKTGGGTAERTFQMSHFLASQGVQCTVLTLDIELDPQRIACLSPASIVALPCLWKRYYLPLVKWKVIRQLVQDANIIHIMGHWSALNAVVYLAARLAKKPYVVCPAGALPLFGRSKLIKKIYNRVIGSAIIRNASAWIAVTKSEFPQFSAYGIDESKIIVIPNGINVDDFPFVEPQVFTNKYELSNSPIILFMGRLNLIKGPDILLNAFIHVQEYLENCQLVFVGPDGGMLSMLQKRAQEAGVAEKVHFVGYVSGYDKSAAYHAANLLVVPSRQEAMSIVALEAMVCGTPVLLTDQCGFSEVKLINPNLETAVDAEKIAEKLVELLANEVLLDDIALSLKDFAIRQYSWNQVIVNYLNLYQKILKEQ